MTPNTEELKALLEKATQGPWSFNRRTKELGPISDHEDQSYGMILPIGDVFGDNWDADARLIALAPTLAARVVALEEVVKAADAMRESVIYGYDPLQSLRDLDRYEAARAKLEERV